MVKIVNVVVVYVLPLKKDLVYGNHTAQQCQYALHVQIVREEEMTH